MVHRSMRSLTLLVCLVFAGQEVPAAHPQELPSAEERIPLGERLVADNGCLACHQAPASVELRLMPSQAPRPKVWASGSMPAG